MKTTHIILVFFMQMYPYKIILYVYNSILNKIVIMLYRKAYKLLFSIKLHHKHFISNLGLP